jgi:hypothetical protein
MSDSSTALVVEGIARAHTDDYSVGTETNSEHVGSDGMINSICRIFSSFTDCLPALCKNRFWMGTGEGFTRYVSSPSTNGLGFSPAGTESSDGYGLVSHTRYGDYQPSIVTTYSHLLGLIMLRVSPSTCGNKPRVWTQVTALLALEVI